MDFLHKIPQVAVMLPPSVKVCRDLRRGVLRYAQTHGPWSLILIEDRNDSRRQTASAKMFSGFIGEPTTPEDVALVSSLHVPTVLVDPRVSGLDPSYRRTLSRSSLIRCDSAEVGRTAASYFLKQAYRSFAYVGAHRRDTWSEERFAAFAETLRKAGFGCPVFRSHERAPISRELSDLCSWLSDLPKPCAVFCAWDFRARQVVDACRMADLLVPDDIAVLGVDDDEAICLSAQPPISSIRLDAERAGYEAAKILDARMRGSRHRETVVYGPAGVTERGADTSFRGSRDPIVRSSLEFIAINASRSLRIGDVARQAGLSARSLERHFLADIGHSVRDAIESVKLDRVRKLLTETNEPIKAIALSSGFSTVSHLTVRFRRETGMSMTDYRARFGG